MGFALHALMSLFLVNKRKKRKKKKKRKSKSYNYKYTLLHKKLPFEQAGFVALVNNLKVSPVLELLDIVSRKILSFAVMVGQQIQFKKIGIKRYGRTYVFLI